MRPEGIAVGGQLDPMRSSRRRLAAVLAFGASALVALSACTSGGASTGASPVAKTSSAGPSSSASTPPSSPVEAPAAVITTTPTATTSVNPTTPVSVSVANGKLTDVKMVNPAGKRVTGRLSDDGTLWKTTEVLGYSKTYTISAAAVNANGKATKKTAHFTTLTPGNMTMPYLQRMGSYPLTDGATYGVAIVPVVHFDEPITDKAAAQQALKVTSSPHVNGVWYWADNQDVHFRPEGYWPAGTKVRIEANVYGVRVGSGLYGQSDVSASFTVGRKQLTIVDDNAPKVDKVRVYNSAGTVLRTMNTSMGQHSGEYVNGSWINFYTLRGTYTVLEHDNPAIMSSASYGLPPNSPHGYPPLSVPYSTKISVDGIYLHEFNSTIWDQDHGLDVSEGCINLRTSDAVWFYDHSLIGDPVVVHGAKGAPTIQVPEGGDWSVPWSTWVKGSAL